MFFLFLFLTSLSFISVFFIIFTKNSIYALWGLISHFFITAILFFFLGIEFIGVIVLIIYIGAIAILFIFGIMLLDLRTLSQPKMNLKWHILGLILFVGGGLYNFFLLFLPFFSFLKAIGPYYHLDLLNHLGKGQTAGSLGTVLLHEYSHLFFISGLILFLALIGALSITQPLSHTK